MELTMNLGDLDVGFRQSGIKGYGDVASKSCFRRTNPETAGKNTKDARAHWP